MKRRATLLVVGLWLCPATGWAQASADGEKAEAEKPRPKPNASNAEARTKTGTTGETATENASKATVRVRVRSSVAVLDPKADVQDIISQLRKQRSERGAESGMPTAVELRRVQQNEQVQAGTETVPTGLPGAGRALGLNRNDRMEKTAAKIERRRERLRQKAEQRSDARNNRGQGRGRSRSEATR